MKQQIFLHWSFMRFIRLLLGIIIVIQAVVASDFVLGFIGSLLAAMALLNLGCCTTGVCYTNKKNDVASEKKLHMKNWK